MATNQEIYCNRRSSSSSSQKTSHITKKLASSFFFLLAIDSCCWTFDFGSYSSDRSQSLCLPLSLAMPSIFDPFVRVSCGKLDTSCKTAKAVIRQSHHTTHKLITRSEDTNGMILVKHKWNEMKWIKQHILLFRPFLGSYVQMFFFSECVLAFKARFNNDWMLMHFL